MTVTRDVVYDLLPAYFAGDLSADSRRLVEAWLRDDPEFAAMAARFERVLAQASAAPRGTGDDEARTLSRARTAARCRGEFRGLAIGYALATIALIAAGLAGYAEGRAFVIAAVVGGTAVLCGAGAYLSDRRPGWMERVNRVSGI